MATWTPDNSLFSLAAGCEHISPMMLSPSNGAERGPALSALPLIIFPKASYNSFSPIQRLWDRGAECGVGGGGGRTLFTFTLPAIILVPFRVRGPDCSITLQLHIKNTDMQSVTAQNLKVESHFGDLCFASLIEDRSS